MYGLVSILAEIFILCFDCISCKQIQQFAVLSSYESYDAHIVSSEVAICGTAGSEAVEGGSRPKSIIK